MVMLRKAVWRPKAVILRGADRRGDLNPQFTLRFLLSLRLALEPPRRFLELALRFFGLFTNPNVHDLHVSLA